MSASNELQATIRMHTGGARRKLVIDAATAGVTDPAALSLQADEVARANAVVASASVAVQNAVERLVAAAVHQIMMFPHARTLEAFVADLVARGDLQAAALSPEQLADAWLAAERTSGTLETNRAMIQLTAVALPAALHGKMPALGISPARHFGKAKGEAERVAAEAAQGTVLLGATRPALWSVLERLVALHGGTLEFPFIATLRKLVDELAGRDDAALAALTDAELRDRWDQAQPG